MSANACVLCKRPGIINGVWMPARTAAALAGRHAVTYRLCDGCSRRPNVAAKVEDVLIARASAARMGVTT